MSICGCTRGMLLWKTPCERPAHGACMTCGTPICAERANRLGPGKYSCPDCAADDKDSGTDTDSSWFSSNDSSGSDSSSADSGSSESGGGDSGSSD